MENLRERALQFHQDKRGKLGIHSKVKLENSVDLSLAYSPGVAEPCLEIHRDPAEVYKYTSKGNMIAVVSNGTAVLGLGNIGALASIPVMEGKAVLFKTFADVDAVPLCLNTMDINQFIDAVKLLEPVFGGINLEDIAAPDCFIIEERLRAEMNIPVFHDDQHGTAIVTAAALINSLKLVRKNMREIQVVVNGAGAAGVSIVKILRQLGVKNIILCDSKGIIYKGRQAGMSALKQELAELTNPNELSGSLSEAVRGSDVFIGVSVAGALKEEMVGTMAQDPIVFALANPNPEITPEAAKRSGVRVIGTGRSDYPNQINNVLAFPGIFRGLLDVRSRKISEEMYMAAAFAIAGLVDEAELNEDHVIPSIWDTRVVTAVADAVSKAALESGAVV
jgi:malate dehydrogenase (oxaloacetate-decarboxylating)